LSQFFGAEKWTCGLQCCERSVTDEADDVGESAGLFFASAPPMTIWLDLSARCRKESLSLPKKGHWAEMEVKREATRPAWRSERRIVGLRYRSTAAASTPFIRQPNTWPRREAAVEETEKIWGILSNDTPKGCYEAFSKRRFKGWRGK
jgi:hypothetical protein